MVPPSSGTGSLWDDPALLISCQVQLIHRTSADLQDSKTEVVFRRLMFYILLTAHHVMILGKWPTWCTILSMYLFLFLTLYMFRAHRAHHQEREIVSIQPLVAVILCQWPCRVQVRSEHPTCTRHSYQHRVTATRGCIDNICLLYGLIEIETFAVHLLRDTVLAITVLPLIIGFVILYDNQSMVFSGVTATCSG